MKTKFNFMIFIVLALVSVFLTILLKSPIFILLAILAIFSPLIYVFVLAVEKVALIKSVSPSKLTEGDWLLENIKIFAKHMSTFFTRLLQFSLCL